MSTGTYNPGPLSINAGEAMLRFRLALYNKTTGFAEYCDANEQANFLVQRDVALSAASVLLPIQPNQYIPAVASGIITAGDQVAADTDGKVQSVEAAPGGHFVLGRALYAAAADLDEITVLTSPQDTAPYTGIAAAVTDPVACAALTAATPAALTAATPAALTAATPAALTAATPAASTYSDPAALTSPTAGNGTGADATTFNGAECDALRADVLAIRDALILAGADLVAFRIPIAANVVDVAAMRTPIAANVVDVAAMRTPIAANVVDVAAMRIPIAANVVDGAAEKTAIDANKAGVDAVIDSLQAAGQMA